MSGFGARDEATVGTRGDKGAVAAEWLCCIDFTGSACFPIFKAILKKFINAVESSGESIAGAVGDGSSSVSMTDKLEAPSSSSNSLLVEGFGFEGTFEYALSILVKRFATSSHSRGL